MEASNRRSLVDEQDANISTFRRRNKIIAIVFTLLVISLTLLITASIIQIRHHNHKPAGIPPLLQFCSVSESPSCLTTFNTIISGKSITEPDQIFAISLQTTAYIINTTLTDDIASNNCSNLLRDGLSRVRECLATMRVNPFVGMLSAEQRDEMTNQIAAAEDDVWSCLNDLAFGETTAKLFDVTLYLSSAFDFVVAHGKIGRILYVVRDYDFYRRYAIYVNLYIVGFQLLFIIGLFCSLFRTR